MINIFRQENETKNTECERYMDYVSRVALPSVKEGNVYYINSLQRTFTIRDAKHYHMEVASIFASLIGSMSAKKLISFDENSRSCAYYDWNEKITWKSKRLKRQDMPYLSDRQYAASLCMGSFHNDGYCRQVCVEELKEWSNTLPYLVLRLNDWVSVIRNAAFESALHRIAVCEVNELFSALPVLDKVKNSGRREQPQVNELEQKIKQQMCLKFVDCRFWEIPGYEITIKNSIYRFINSNKVFELPQLEQLLALEKSSYGKRLLIQAILTQHDCMEEKFRQYLSDKSSVVRYYALEYYYIKYQDAWTGLEMMLIDKARKIRDYASYILRKHTNFDVLGFYKERLTKGKDKVALLGIGENGTINELGFVTPYLEDPDEHLRKTALIAYGMLAKEQGEDIYWKFLQTPIQMLYIQAYRLSVKFDVKYGAGNIYGLYNEYKDKPVADYLICLLTRESSWKRLPYLLMLCDEETLSENIKGHILYAINCRSMYGKVTQQEAQFILTILNEKKSCLPKKTVDGILWDLKYVVR